jgi:hypothetical protein
VTILFSLSILFLVWHPELARGRCTDKGRAIEEGDQGAKAEIAHGYVSYVRYKVHFNEEGMI